jgi:hypothetical protein
VALRAEALLRQHVLLLRLHVTVVLTVVLLLLLLLLLPVRLLL